MRSKEIILACVVAICTFLTVVADPGHPTLRSSTHHPQPRGFDSFPEDLIRGSTISPLGDCKIPKILHGSLKAQIVDDKFFDFSTFRFRTRSYYETISEGNYVLSEKVIDLFCEDFYTFQGSNSQNVSVKCSKGRWNPDPVCLPRGQIYIPTTTIKPRLSSPTTISLVPTLHESDGATASTKMFSLAAIASTPIVSIAQANEEVTERAAKTDPTTGNLEGHCKIPRILHGSLKDQILDEKFFDLTISRFRKRSYYKTVSEESLVPYYKVLFLVCEYTYTFQCTDDNFVPVQCFRGRWNPDPVCLRHIICPQFPPHFEVSITYSKSNKMGSVATFRCSKTSKLIGEKNATCQEDGSWSSPMPRCDAIVCPFFATGEDRKVSYSKENHVGSKATFSCPTHATLVGSSISDCRSDGTWSSSEQLCMNKTTCALFPLTSGLKIKYSNENVPGSNASFSCSSKKVLNGHPFAVCQENGTWSHTRPSCEGTLGCLLNIKPSSHLQVQPLKDSYRFGEQITLSCPAREKMSNNVQLLMCLGNQRWSDTFPDCIQS